MKTIRESGGHSRICEGHLRASPQDFEPLNLRTSEREVPYEKSES